MDQDSQVPESNQEKIANSSMESTVMVDPLAIDTVNTIDNSILEEFGPMGEGPLVLPNDFSVSLNALESVEDKLALTLRFMQQSLEKGGGQHFKEFWDARKLCITFFKEPVNATHRVQLWAAYSELCREARRLKELFDEQSAFLTEQMEMAISGLKNEVAHLSDRIHELPSLPEIDQAIPLSLHKEEYQQIQKELNGLNAFAQRTTALRKELIHTDIKLRNKNRLFQQLSALGDAIFPKRKELIQRVSLLYVSDVEQFIQSAFLSDLPTADLFNVRDQIKLLQNIAKLLTLSTEVFNKTRLELSECWDSIKSVVKERKRTQSEMRHEKKQNKAEVLFQLDDFKNKFLQKTADIGEIERGLKQLFVSLRFLSLLPPDIRFLKEQIKEVEILINAQREEEKSSKKTREQEKGAARGNELQEIAGRIEALLQNPQESTQSSLHLIEKELSSLSLTRKEHYDFEHLLNKLKNAIASFERKRILSSDDPEKARFLQERELLIQQKNELKVRLDSLRKEQGASGTNFSYALQLDEMIREEKERVKNIEEELNRLGSL